MRDEKKHGAQFTAVSLILRVKSWRRSLTELQYKFMIAAALNGVIYETGPVYKKFLITGYLITGRRIYIICKLRSISLDTVLALFNEKIKLSLVHLQRKKLEEERYKGLQHTNEFSIPEPMFELFPFHNEWLKELITGNSVHLRYYEPRLARLKQIIYKEQFCSITDYRGEEGPVVVSKEIKKLTSLRQRRPVKRKKI